ncbi:hypothetical protein BJ973_008981 [Actinoplanes tereljensis]|uniref:hypothetical protein n=1 Tax=Paractinoplanes tereljensis TaxID=571912 RepID=UPI001942BCFF|nr:hypothetical protein [Actinoplanes tereljensis]
MAAVLVLAAAMKRAPGWSWPFRGVGVFAYVNAPASLTGLFERLLAAFGAAAIAALALGICPPTVDVIRYALRKETRQPVGGFPSSIRVRRVSYSRPEMTPSPG